MGRNNGTFKYKAIQSSGRDSTTGFVVSSVASSDWKDGCECQIDKSIPAKQIVGTDGQIYSYSYDVFIPKYFTGDIRVGAKFQITSDDGEVDEFTIQGVDTMNRKYIEVWG